MQSLGLAPSPRSVVSTEGSARLLHFHGEGAASPQRTPLLLVPSLINRWYVLDLRRGSSLIEALLARGIDLYLLDWGCPGDEDRYLDWDMVNARLRRAVRKVLRHSGAAKLSMLGYCMGGTLAAINAALDPDRVGALINLLGPIDFSQGGMLARLVDPRSFDAAAVAAAGNVSALQMQAGFVALRPTLEVAKWVRFADTGHRREARDSFLALQAWASDNIPFPAAAYETYITDLYQRNALVAGQHRVAGTAVDLARIRCPVLTVVADRDTICPAAAATALNDHCGASDAEIVRIRGGHVGAVVADHARDALYGPLAQWLEKRTTLKG